MADLQVSSHSSGLPTSLLVGAGVGLINYLAQASDWFSKHPGWASIGLAVLGVFLSAGVRIAYSEWKDRQRRFHLRKIKDLNHAVEVLDEQLKSVRAQLIAQEKLSRSLLK